VVSTSPQKIDMFDSNFPYLSQRMPVMARNIVATSQPLASQAGVRTLQQGGNAVDAALAAAITLTVVEPTGNGLGSDAFAIIWDGERLHGINGSGRSPAAWTYERFAGREKMPMRGWDAVTVPGAVSVWMELSRRFGRMPFARLFESAIEYAAYGFPVTPKIAQGWSRAPEMYADFPEFSKTFLPHGRAPLPGEVFTCPEQAVTLEEIAATEGESFYRGMLAEKIADCAKHEGGMMTLDDLASHRPQWIDPLAQEYHGYQLHELPPNGQGLAALIAMGILDHLNIQDYPVDSADSIHLQIEAVKLAFAVVKQHLADPEFMRVDYRDFLDHDYLVRNAKTINLQQAHFPETAVPHDKGTVYLSAADADGMMVSFIQSNFWGFGSGVVIPGTGIAMQNRGYGFSLERGHPNQVDGGKRPYQTIIPAFVTEQGKPKMSFGVMGGHMQPQGHVQMMVRVFDYHQNPQTASDAPRWCLTEDNQVAVEPGFSAGVLSALSSRGHTILTDVPESVFGGAQLTYKISDHYIAGSDHRKDGLAAGY